MLLAVALCALVLSVTACTGAPPPADDDCDAIRADLGPLLHARLNTGPSPESSGLLARTRMWLERQLVPHDSWVRLGWCQFRAGYVDDAGAAFEEASRRLRFSHDATVGLGYVALRRQQSGEAALMFSDALEREPGGADAREGLLLAIEQMPEGDPAASTAREAARKLATEEASNPRVLYAAVSADRKSGGPGELRRRPEAGATKLSWFARAGVDYLEVRRGDGQWRPLFVKGVNIGPALPGKFPSEAPEDVETWTQWLGWIADLGANAVRVYTLLPPAFYRALADHNRSHPESHLWLLQGVWADLPPDDDFDQGDYLAAFHAAIARAIDAVHGDLVLAPRRGTSRGVYDTDVSQHTLAWIVGREWEPFAVVAYEEANPGSCDHAGRYVTVTGGRAMECWIGRSLEFTAEYEARRYGQARPLSFANWPTLDPLTHPTEATRAEEDAWRLRLEGIPVPERLAPAWDDDAATVDATRMAGSPGFEPGVFASYHIYPNYPYFINLEPAYGKVRDRDGVNRYAAYLRALKAYHGHQPVLVAEYGMSTSRGVAHLQPEGLHHGGHHEPEAMREYARLLRTIYDEAMAGGVAFEFIDEWFKSTWPTSPFEVPEEQRPFWFNAESPEQAYGLFAVRPVAPVRLDGDDRDWSGIQPLATGSPGATGWLRLRAVRATYDAGWLYLLLETGGHGRIDWSRVAYSIGLDTYDADRGERSLPAPAACGTSTGVEFAVSLRGPAKSELLVTPPYEPRHPAESGIVGMMESPLTATGRWQIPSLLTNRERYTRDGSRIADERVYPGKLHFGSLDPGSREFATNADVAVGPDRGVLELRLPWGLLNFADPSTASVLHSPRSGAAFESTRTDGIRIYICAADPLSGAIESTLAPGGEAFLRLPGWTEPAYVVEPKQGLGQLASVHRSIPNEPDHRSQSQSGERD